MLANQKGRRAMHCSIKTQSNYTKRGKPCAGKPRLVLDLLLDKQESGTGFIFNPITERSNAKPE